MATHRSDHYSDKPLRPHARLSRARRDARHARPQAQRSARSRWTSTRSFAPCSVVLTGLRHVDAIRVASKTIGGLYDGATTRELDAISIDTAASLIAEEPQYSRLAARLLLATIVKEVSALNLHSFSQAIAYGHQEGVVNKATAEFVQTHARKLNHAIDDSFSDRFEYFGLRTVYDRYLLRDPISRSVIETPQHFFLRVACGLAGTPHEAIEFYRLIASLDYMPSFADAVQLRHEARADVVLLSA